MKASLPLVVVLPMTLARATPLHHACDRGQPVLVKELLAAGHEVDDRYALTNETPLHVAAQRRKSELVHILLQSNASVDLRCDNWPIQSCASLAPSSKAFPPHLSQVWVHVGSTRACGFWA